LWSVRIIRISGTSDTFLWAVGCILHVVGPNARCSHYAQLGTFPHSSARDTLYHQLRTAPFARHCNQFEISSVGRSNQQCPMACRKGTFCKPSSQESSLRLQEVGQAQKRRKLWRRRRKHTSAEQCELWQRTRKQANANRYHFTRAVLLRLPLLLLLLLLLLLDSLACGGCRGSRNRR
jgi:hypothetical protein